MWKASDSPPATAVELDQEGAPAEAEGRARRGDGRGVPKVGGHGSLLFTLGDGVDCHLTCW